MKTCGEAAKPQAAGKRRRALAQQIVAAPQLVAPQGGAGARRRLARRTSAGCAAGKALKRLLAASPKVEALLAGIAEGSPFLWDLVARRCRRACSRCSKADPDAHFAALLRETARRLQPPGRRRGDAAAAPHEGRGRAADRACRHRRRLAADADHHALTELADTAVGAAVRFLLRDAAQRGQAQAGRPGAAGARLRLHRARHGQDGRVRAQLLQRHRPDRVLRRRTRAALADVARRRPSTCASRAAW